MSPSPTEIQKFITDHFSRDELDAFCLDNFREFYHHNEGAEGGKIVYARRLVEYCGRHGKTKSLLIGLEKERPEPFAQRFKAVQVESAPVEIPQPIAKPDIPTEAVESDWTLAPKPIVKQLIRQLISQKWVLSIFAVFFVMGLLSSSVGTFVSFTAGLLMIFTAASFVLGLLQFAVSLVIPKVRGKELRSKGLKLIFWGVIGCGVVTIIILGLIVLEGVTGVKIYPVATPQQ